MDEALFRVLQNYLYDYCVDQELITNKSRILYDADNINYYDLLDKGDCIVISTVNQTPVFLQPTIQYNYVDGGQRQYYDKMRMKIFLKYYGKFASGKMSQIVSQLRHMETDGYEYLKQQHIEVFYLGTLKTFFQKIGENLLECAVQEAEIRYITRTSANKKNISIEGADLDIN